MKRKKYYIIGLLVILLSLCGCSNNRKGSDPSGQAAEEQMREEAKEMMSDAPLTDSRGEEIPTVEVSEETEIELSDTEGAGGM